MTVVFRFTSADLERFPDLPGVRYEVIAGASTFPARLVNLTSTRAGYLASNCTAGARGREEV